MRAQHVLPRWRGFNLTEIVSAERQGAFDENDFGWIADLGFDFVRIPMSYRVWTDPEDPWTIREERLAPVDAAVRLGERHGLHVNLNFHRGPGYCCGPEPPEPWVLWSSAEALDAFCHHWRFFARRYRGIPSARLSFNLLNEPPPPRESLAVPKRYPMQDMRRADHERVMRSAIAAIREVDPDRLLIVDAMWFGRGEPTYELADLGVAQSTRAYVPMGLSHYRAPWWREGSMDFPLPVWPGGLDHERSPWDRARLEQLYERWAELAASGIGVHCGEGGCYIHTPHDVFLRWFEEVLEILTAHGIGYALWNFRGDFGILDSGRSDVAYEECRGRALDRKLLDLLRRY